MTRLVCLFLCLALAGCGADATATKVADNRGDREVLDGDAVLPAAQDGKGAVVTLDGLKSRAPADWEKQEPKSKLRLYQFRVPHVEGDPKDAELLIFNFGPGGGGSVKDNLKRWKDKFEAPRGKTLDDVAKVEEFKVGTVPVTYLDIHGTYLFKFPPFAPNAKTTPLPNYRMFGVIFASENGPYYITLVGPARTLNHQKMAFDRWLKSFK